MKDSCFIRGKIPMTKSEVRAVSLAKLNLKKNSILYDIGAGTGSLSIEAALFAEQGNVYAFEQKEEGCELIKKNAQKFKVENLILVSGVFPESLSAELPFPDRVFIGGSSGYMSKILDLFCTDSSANGIPVKKPVIVINAIALETVTQIVNYLKERKLEAEIVSVQVSRAEKIGGYHMMQGMNPVYVITINGDDEA